MTSPPHIAITGAGITGLCLAAGLQARNIPFTIYERAPHSSAAAGGGGAGIGLSPNAERAMEQLAPCVRAAYERVANPNGEDYFQWVDGLSREVVFRLFVGEGCFRGCRRGDLLDGLMADLPEGRVRFGKALREVVDVGVEGKEQGGGVRLLFEDGTEAVADAGGWFSFFSPRHMKTKRVEDTLTLTPQSSAATASAPKSENSSSGPRQQQHTAPNTPSGP